MKLAIVVPIRSFRWAKQRLSPLLDDEERELLARTMAQDVLGVVSRLPGRGRFVVSEDEEVLRLARGFGLALIRDHAVAGQSAAARQGFEAAWERGYGAGLTVPGDVPGVRLEEMEELCDFRPDLEVVAVPDRRGRGTNGLRLTPPNAIVPRFGEDSLNRHRAEAIRANRSYAVRLVPSLSYDLDDAPDVMAFLRLAPETATLSLLREWKVLDRFVPDVSPPPSPSTPVLPADARLRD